MLFLGPRQHGCGGTGKRVTPRLGKTGAGRTHGARALVLIMAGLCVLDVSRAQVERLAKQSDVPPRVAEARRFLAQRSWMRGYRPAARRGVSRSSASKSVAQSSGTGIWLPLGPAAVATSNFGLVTGRVSALALDPSDPTGNSLYVGTTGGGVWAASNADAADLSTIAFTPLTDDLGALADATDASISIGALTVQPGGTGVVLAGTGDPNDVLDSYYGAGILRSADNGTTWTLIQSTRDAEDGLSGQDYGFVGEGFAGFAWSTANPQLVVAAVSQAYEGTLVNADRSNLSYEGLYYSSDSGATWHLATITDGNGEDVQGPQDVFAEPDGNAATAVVWNPARQLFVAAVRYHGYYQSSDGVTWTRMAAQPGSGITASRCPNNLGITGSISCPIFRGALTVNPVSGDTFAWTVDVNNQDQGLWQDTCNWNGTACGDGTITFATQWSTAALDASTGEGSATIANGNYNLTLAAIPSGQDTMVLAGDNDLWKCSLAAACAWRNTTNSATCTSAQVGEFQHALAWNAANPLEIFDGNDSGLWRSTDGIGETGAACSASDATHFQNLNGSLGSLAEVVSLSPVFDTPYALMAGLGVNGTAGVKAAAVTADWPQILSGSGGPVAIDPKNDANWYVNNQPGVSIYRCSQSGPCTPSDFGSGPVVTNADVNLAPGAMLTPAPFLVDPLDSTQLLIATCQLWRGPASGVGWSAANAVTPILDSGATSASCNGDALVRSISAVALPGGGEIVYLGMYGLDDGGTELPGHVLRVVMNPSSGATPVVSDLTLNPVLNDPHPLNSDAFDVSAVFADPSDASGSTVYVTVAGFDDPTEDLQFVYRSTDGGAHWTALTANLPSAPINSVAVDPQNANVVYLATDQGVYFTTQVTACAQAPYVCWSPFGSGLPGAPVVALSAAPATASDAVLVAATYGRGIWQTPLWSAGTSLTTATVSPSALSFGNQEVGGASAAQVVTLQNTGSVALVPTMISVSGAFSETDNCVNATVPTNGSCAIQVIFSPTAMGQQTGQMIIDANVSGGQLAVSLAGTGTAAGEVTATPAILNFASVAVNSTSAPLSITVANNGSAAIPISGISVSGPFALAGNACGTVSLAANSDCQVQVSFTPTQAGAASGVLTLTDGAGTQTVELTGTGLAAATDTLSGASLAFPATATGQSSVAQTITLTNSGGEPLESISVTVSGSFEETNGCTAQLAGNSSCTIAVQFVPTQVGNVSGTLTVTDALRAQTVTLAGTGVAPAALSASPTNLTFTSPPGIQSAPQTLTVANNGGAPMANIGFAVTGPAAASYAISATTCGAVLASGSSCTAQVVFTPAVMGPIAAVLAISTSTAGVLPVSVPLSGTGFDFSVSVSGPGSVTVASGQTANFPFLITPSGSQGAFSFACGAVPKNASCTFNPPSESLNLGVEGNVTAVIATAQSSSTASAAARTDAHALRLVCGLLLLPLLLARWRRLFLLSVLLVVITACVDSCTSSSGGTGGTPTGSADSASTPPGTYTIPITITASGVSHSLNVTLTVD